MKNIFFLGLFTLFFSANSQKKNVYFIAGQGADERLFSEIQLDTTLFQPHFITYIIPNKKEYLSEYAFRLSKQIDTTQSFILIGTSLGGMISVEMNKFLKPEKTIIISSAKCRKELPFRYTFQKIIPIYEIFPPKLIKIGAKVMQPIVEPDRNKYKTIFKSMLDDKNPVFLKRTIFMITHWKNECLSNDKKIYHIHGNNDHTIPIKNIKYDFLVEGGSHMMTLTRAKEIQKVINSIL